MTNLVLSVNVGKRFYFKGGHEGVRIVIPAPKGAVSEYFRNQYGNYADLGKAYEASLSSVAKAEIRAALRDALPGYDSTWDGILRVQVAGFDIPENAPVYSQSCDTTAKPACTKLTEAMRLHPQTEADKEDQMRMYVARFAADKDYAEKHFKEVWDRLKKDNGGNAPSDWNMLHEMDRLAAAGTPDPPKVSDNPIKKDESGKVATSGTAVRKLPARTLRMKGAG